MVPALRMWDELDREFARMWDEMLRPARGEVYLAPIDVVETPTAFKVQALLPGYGPEDVTVSVEDGVLSITAERKAEQEENGEARYLRREIALYGRYRRLLRLPEEVDVDGITAHFKNGLLTVELPKAPKAAAKAIPIRTDA
ncbi:MAG: Hsp20/alpha crystallin family protein [Firmicutes bacterium]|nr:Hsp20/alpha crystallin family protein [Bacillota bacterium]